MDRIKGKKLNKTGKIIKQRTSLEKDATLVIQAQVIIILKASY
jgi:hypothetical protein